MAFVPALSPLRVVSLKKDLDDLEEKVNVAGYEAQQAFSDAFKIFIEPPAVERLRQLNLRLNDFLPKLADKQVRETAINYFRSEIQELGLTGGFIARSWQKPKGYAGDYEMMSQIYHNDYVGSSYFSKIIHRYGINEFSSQSVRYRKDYLKRIFMINIF